MQAKYCDYLEKVENELKILDLHSETTQSFKFDEFKEAIINKELTIPVVGAFSAGKSSFINSFLGKDYLSVNITPETAIATELRYSADEKIEAIASSGSPTTYEITEMASVISKSEQFKFIRLYLNNANLKSIAPLILVDMPGLNSPMDLHNRAIIEYIEKGVYYLVLTSIEEGTLTRSMVRQLLDIKEFGKDFSFFLSKTNLRSEKEVEEIKQNLLEQINDYLEMSKEIVSIDDNGGDNLRKLLDKIDPDELIENIFANPLKDQFFTISDSINTAISSFSKTKNENEESLQILESSLNNLIDEKKRLIQETTDQYTNINVDLIVEKIGRKLLDNADELANKALSSDQDELKNTISEIVRHAVIYEMKKIVDNFSDEIVNKFAIKIKEINSETSDFIIPDLWVDKIADSAKKIANYTDSSIKKIIEDRKGRSDTGNMYKTITTALSILSNVLNPVLELVIVFLPNVINMLFKNSNEQRQKEAVKSKIMTEVIPGIKSNVRNNIPPVMKEQLTSIIDNIGSRFEEAITVRKEAVAEAQKKLEKENTDINAQISNYKNALSNINTLANNLIFKIEGA
jgi:GTPase SAR1 family protein